MPPRFRSGSRSRMVAELIDDLHARGASIYVETDLQGNIQTVAIPAVSLVNSVELARDEAVPLLQVHRSGRSGQKFWQSRENSSLAPGLGHHYHVIYHAGGRMKLASASNHEGRSVMQRNSLPSPPNDVGFNPMVGSDAAPCAVNPKTGKRKHVGAIVIFTKQFHQFLGWGFAI